MNARTGALAILLMALCAAPAQAIITGSSTVSMCGEAGNWIDVTFTSTTAVRLIDAHWDFTATSVWLDRDGTSVCAPQNNGVDDYEFYFDDPPGVDTQTFGLTASGFDSGDYFRFTMDLDIGGGGSPFTTDYYGAVVRVEFSDGTILNATFAAPYDSPNGAMAAFATPEPDLAFDAKPGWYAPCVPRPAADATYTSVPAPASLTGDAALTWLNSACRNVGDAQAGSSLLRLYVDGQLFTSHTLWIIGAGQYNGFYNDGPHTVRGGRHTIKAVCDAANAVVESDETNNVHARQWIWAPTTLPLDQAVTRAAPPVYDADTQYLSGYWWNCDGLRFVPQASRPWSTVWIEASTDLDAQYTLRMHPAATGPQDGFGTNYALSPLDERTRAVIANTRHVPQLPYDVGILNYGGAGAGADYRVAHICNSPYPFDFGIEPPTPYSGSRLLSFEFHVQAAELGPASLTLYSDPDDGPVHMGWLPSTFTYGSLANLQDRVTTDAAGLARIDLDLTTTGDYLAVVYCNRDEHPGSMAVNVGLYKARPDLQPTTLSGWFAPVVPRPAADAALLDCPLPETLPGNTAGTWMNIACLNSGTAAADTVGFGLYVDGGFSLGIRNLVTPLAAGLPRTWLNLTRSGAPWTIPGGRHTLAVQMDYLSDLSELCERNNPTGRQYCWSPLALAPATATERPAVPPRTGGFELCDDPDPLAYNCDGLRIPWASLDPDGWWRGVAVMPQSGVVDVDVRLHAPAAGTRSGFGMTPLAESGWAAGDVDFVLVNYNDAPDGDCDVGVVQGASGPGTFTAEAAVSDWIGNFPEGSRGPFTLPAGHMLHLYEMRLAAGPMLVRVDDLGAPVDWGISLYTRSDPYQAKSDAMPDGIAWQAAAGGAETILVDVPTVGYYCLAVWKARAGGLNTNGEYSLWFTPGATAAPPHTPTPVATRFVSAAPNPFNPLTTFHFDLRSPDRCTVELYDLQGRLVRRLLATTLPAGRHAAAWNGLDESGRAVASGVYVARLRTAEAEDHCKVVLAR